MSGPRGQGVGAVVSAGQQERREAGPLTGKGQARKAALLARRPAAVASVMIDV